MKPNQRIVHQRNSGYLCLHCRTVQGKNVWYTRSPHHLSLRTAALIAQAEAEALHVMAKDWRTKAELKAFQTEFNCPHCHALLIEVGPQFKAPRKQNKHAWRLIRKWLMKQRPWLANLTGDEELKWRKWGFAQKRLEHREPNADMREWNGVPRDQ